MVSYTMSQVTCGPNFMPFNLTVLTVAALRYVCSNRDTVKCWGGRGPQVYIL